MPQIEEATDDLASLPPYDVARSCPKCRARFRLVPGDRFSVEHDRALGDGGYLICTCPRCLSAVELEVGDAAVMLECFIQMSYRDYISLANRAERLEKIDRLMDRFEDMGEIVDYIDGRIADLERTAARPVERAPQPRREYDDDGDDRPAPRRRRERDEDGLRPPTRERPVYGPRGAVDREREASMMEGVITVGGGSGRRGSTIGEDDDER